ncbi:hypothetical protein AB0J37_08085, partial [Microbispora rosea]|uniref:hypothetical protein n=1 Tax=Microbispora rosea TaxID=58117 RepID=UPI00342E44A4
MVVLGVFVAGVGVPDGLVTRASAAVEAPQQERSVEARPVAVPTPHVKGEEASHPAKKPPTPVWPKSGSARVDHKSVISALILSGVQPVWVHGDWDGDLHMSYP